MTEKVRVRLTWARALCRWHFRAHLTSRHLPTVRALMSVKECICFLTWIVVERFHPVYARVVHLSPAFRNTAATGCEVSQKSLTGKTDPKTSQV